ncbi:MAG: hypothetical protein R3176_02345 [Woeseiaceae bacterium]|nr:hypothetical protein [Woeseiaceae bacterium]
MAEPVRNLCASARAEASDLQSKRRLLLLAMIWTLLVIAAAAQANTPTIRLFPTTVVEDLRQTGEVARDMETGLQEVIGRLDQQQQLYLESKCQGAENDPGCQRLARQLGATYLDMLTIMEERLPDMEHTVNNTRLSLEKNLRSELGHKMSSWTLQESLVGSSATEAEPQKSPTLRGRSGMRLSERFRQYHQLVATSGARGDQSLAVLASDIYLDMEETSLLIQRTRQEIARATLMEQLNQSFGIITPEMMEVVGGVKSILFGDADARPLVAGPPPAYVEQAYRSPLEQ